MARLKEDLLTLKKAKKKRDIYNRYHLSLQDVKELLYTFHYSDFINTKDYHKDFAARELLVEEIADGPDGQSYSVFFALKGSPPKGRAIFFTGGGDRACGAITFLSPNQPPHGIKDVWLTDFDDKLERRYENGSKK